MNPNNPIDNIPRNPSPCQLIVVGQQIAELLTGPDGFGGQAEVVRSETDFDSWAASPGNETADLILIECPTLFPEQIDLIRDRMSSARAIRTIVVYHFTQETTLKRVEQNASNITPMAAPVTPTDLKLACEADLALAAIRGNSPRDPIHRGPTDDKLAEEERGDLLERQFSDRQLSKISKISTSVQCECPHHLVSILTALNAFERYSHECENRNANDATLHAFLHRRTAQARSMMEDALTILAETEGLDIRP